METPRNALRVVFATSLLAAVFWAVGFGWEPAFGRDAPIAVLVPIATGGAALICWPAFRNGRLKVARTTSFGKTLAVFALRVVAAYVILVPFTGAFVWALAQFFSANPNDADVQLFVWLMALWFPLWLAPAIGAEWSWRAMRKEGLA
jgi:hypothetical protein